MAINSCTSNDSVVIMTALGFQRWIVLHPPLTYFLLISVSLGYISKNLLGTWEIYNCRTENKWEDTQWDHITNTLRSRLNGRHFADDIFNWISWRYNHFILIEISLKFGPPRGRINNKPPLDQVMAWWRTGDCHYLNQWWFSFVSHIWFTRSLGITPFWRELWLMEFLCVRILHL